MPDQSKSDMKGQLEWIIREGADTIITVSGQDLIAIAPGEAILQGTCGKKSAFIRVEVTQAESSKLSTWLQDLFISLLNYASEVLLGEMRKTHLQRVEVSIVSLEALSGYELDLNQIEAMAFFSNGSTEGLTGQLDWNVTQGGEYIRFHDGDYVLHFVRLGLGQVESFWERKTDTINIKSSAIDRGGQSYTLELFITQGI